MSYYIISYSIISYCTRRYITRDFEYSEDGYKKLKARPLGVEQAASLPDGPIRGRDFPTFLSIGFSSTCPAFAPPFSRQRALAIRVPITERSRRALKPAPNALRQTGPPACARVCDTTAQTPRPRKNAAPRPARSSASSSMRL